MNKKPNVILITVDALRADHLGFMGYKKNITPNIDALAKESAVFTNAFSTGPNTPYSFPAILTSTFPLDYQGVGKIDKPRVLISEVLRKAGFITAGFHSNPFLSGFFGYNRGWDFFEEIEVPDSPLSKYTKTSSFILRWFKSIAFSTFPSIYYWVRYLGAKYLKLGAKEGASVATKLRVDADFLNRIIKDFIYSVKNQEKPFFLWSHFMDVHDPYLPKECYFKKRSYDYLDFFREQRFPQHLNQFPNKKALRKYMEKHKEKGIEAYDGGIEYLDYKIGELLSFFKKEGLYDNSIIIITADHGDEFLEHGGGGHSYKLYNELLHVPLLIKTPRIIPQTIREKVSLINLPSTICDLLGVEKPRSFKGGNLFKSSQNLIFHQLAFNRKEIKAGLAGLEVTDINQCQIACQDKKWKYILNYANLEEELYSFLEDSKEQKNLSKKNPWVLKKMRDKVKEFKKENPPLSLVKK